MFFSTTAVYAHEEELFSPVEVKDGSNLSIVECVALAYKNSPKIRHYKYNLDIATSNVGMARSQYFPTLSAGVGFYNENNSNRRDYENYYRELPRVGVSLNQLVWNFGKTSALIKMEEFNKIAAEYEFMDSLCSTLFDIKAHYYALLKAHALMQVAQNNVEINEKFVKISQKIPDKSTAEINLNRAKIEQLEAENNYKNAKVNLANAMYLDEMSNFTIKNTPTFNFNNDYKYNDNNKKTEVFVAQNFPFTKDKAVEIAYASSPDLRALEATQKAMEQSLLFIKRTYMPELSANVGYGYNNTNVSSNNSSLQVGVNLSAGVNLMELKYAVKSADAQVSIAENEIKLFKKDLYYEIKRAFNNVEKNENAVYIAQTNVIAAIKNLNIIIEKYKTNEVDYTSLQDAKNDYITAVTQYIERLYDYNIALTQVEHALHYHLVDIHHRSEHAMTYHSDDLIKHINEALGCDQKETGKRLKFRKVNEAL